MPASFTSIVKAGDFILRTPILKSIFVPTAKFFVSQAGYREMGLKFDDIIHDENPIVEKAVSRLPKSELYARNFRTLTCAQLAITHHLLPKDQAVKAEQDKPYLLPYILELEAEAAEKQQLDNITV